MDALDFDDVHACAIELVKGLSKLRRLHVSFETLGFKSFGGTMLALCAGLALTLGHESSPPPLKVGASVAYDGPGINALRAEVQTLEQSWLKMNNKVFKPQFS